MGDFIKATPINNVTSAIYKPMQLDVNLNLREYPGTDWILQDNGGNTLQLIMEGGAPSWNASEISRVALFTVVYRGTNYDVTDISQKIQTVPKDDLIPCLQKICKDLSNQASLRVVYKKSIMQHMDVNDALLRLTSIVEHLASRT